PPTQFGVSLIGGGTLTISRAASISSSVHIAIRRSKVGQDETSIPRFVLPSALSRGGKEKLRGEDERRKEERQREKEDPRSDRSIAWARKSARFTSN
ncbi:hypothetical protein X777_05820, partial [Ooceraea biroi]